MMQAWDKENFWVPKKNWTHDHLVRKHPDQLANYAKHKHLKFLVIVHTRQFVT